jgi:hypothetical protein
VAPIELQGAGNIRQQKEEEKKEKEKYKTQKLIQLHHQMGVV